jgi:3-hydroxyisobutyrate dehydrogenase
MPFLVAFRLTCARRAAIVERVESARRTSDDDCEGDVMRYGFVGLGSLGVHLAGSLLREGLPLTVNDLDESLADGLVAGGATWAASPAEVARVSDAVITCLPSPEAVAAVVLGERGILEGLAAGGTWIDMSTNDAHELQRLADFAAGQGVATLEAPVTGGVHRAAAGMISVLVGGDEAVFRAHRPAFDAMGGRVFYIGPLGKASVIKVITNMLAFIHLVADGEALMLAKRGGVDLKLAWDVIKASSGNSFVHETEGQLILNGSYNINFTMDLARKDLYFAHQMGREFGVPLELGGLTEQIFARARALYGGDAQSPLVVKMLEDAVGTDLRAPGFPAELAPE